MCGRAQRELLATYLSPYQSNEDRGGERGIAQALVVYNAGRRNDLTTPLRLLSIELLFAWTASADEFVKRLRD